MRQMKIATAIIFVVVMTGCSRPVQRFIPMGDNAALDTKTGRACNPFPQGKGPTTLPYCHDLYKE